MNAPVRVMDIVGCARCRADGHKQLEFHRFTRPVEVAGSGESPYTHWAICPTTGEPILLRTVPKP